MVQTPSFVGNEPVLCGCTNPVLCGVFGGLGSMLRLIRMLRIFYGLGMRKIGMTGFVRDAQSTLPY